MSGPAAPAGVLPEPKATPAWVFVLALVGVAIAAVVPVAVAAYILIVPLTVLFLWYFAVEPEMMLPIFILAVPVIPMLPKGLIPVPGLNFETFFVLTLAAAAVKMHLAEDPPIKPNEFVRPVLTFTILLLLSAVYSILAGKAFGHSWRLGWFELSPGSIFSNLKNIVFYFFLAPIAFRLVNAPNRMRACVQMVAIVAMVVSAESLVSLAQNRAGELGVGRRAEGLLFNEPNALGGFLALMTGLFLALTLSARLGFRERIFYALTAATTGVGLLFSFSRGGWLGMVAGLVVFAFLRGARAWAAIAILALTATVWMPEAVIDRVSGTLKDRRGFQTEDAELEGSARKRLDRWVELPGQWAQAPLLGHGFMSYGKVWGRLGRGGEARGPHSTHIKLAVEQGLVGLAMYAWLFWILYRNAREVRRRDEDPLMQGLAMAYIVALACLFMLDVTGNRFLHGPTMTFMWIIGGGLARAARHLPQKRPIPTTRANVPLKIVSRT